MFSISATGTREGVIKHIRAAKASGEKPSKDDQAQLEAAKVFLVSEVANLPEKFNGARLHAEGHNHEGGRTFNVTIVPQQLHV